MSTTNNRRRSLWATPEANVYNAMKQRCYNPNDKAYHNYGGRGIRVCRRWKDSLENFLADMGPRPSGTMLDREDTNGHYTPNNCRWVTRTEQNNNRRNNILLTHEGRTQTLAQWARELGMREGRLYHRIKAGWPVTKALTTGWCPGGRRPKRLPLTSP